MLKLVNLMNPINVTSATDLRQLISNYQHKADQCEDVIKQLSGAVPDNSALLFSISGKEIVRFDLGEYESDFAMSFFVSWLQRYRLILAALKDRL